jgi:hypothetical protein
MTIAACASAAAAAASARARLPEPMGPLNSNAVRLAMVEKWWGTSPLEIHLENSGDGKQQLKENQPFPYWTHEELW